ncbi:type II toxin-antitoxin system RelE/ParE family toxin [Methylobacterium sp. J-048]|uniref:type II toxin-antitoxin system RelE/ParE family toxin n=1 Tax=Methylobacterium sp. J-048 TaxID=2836635 RepID=UPI001FB964F1|nr:type II toxin-antitoxin system RelE/ParE family toxin [Methylobacterium sp. J-048]MCJ2057146.1 type II toxin-antitoxin system RelE/ParE family toxin [Methylobacterium sp. J-048]
MRRPVIWSRAALDDLKEQIRFVARDHPAVARQVAIRIQEAAEALGETATGRPGRVTGIYEKSLIRLPYIVAYAMRRTKSRESVVILRVIHTARNWPRDEWPT